MAGCAKSRRPVLAGQLPNNRVAAGSSQAGLCSKIGGVATELCALLEAGKS